MRKVFSVLLAIAIVFPLLFTQVPNANAQSGATIDPLLTEKLANTTGAVQVIVTFEGDGKPTAEQLDILEAAGVNTGITMNALPIAGVLATKAQVDALASNSEIRSLYLNEKVKYYNADATEITGVDKARIDAKMTKENGGMPVSGKGVGVVVNDSGVDGTHKDHQLRKNLVQNVLGSTNLNSIVSGVIPITYTEDVPNTDTNSGHGTHVAGTVGGTGAMSGGKYEGAAPGADLIGYGTGGALFVLDGIGGFDYAISHQEKYNIGLITNSWGSSGGFDPDHPVNVASKEAYDRGITVLFAAGNEGPGEDTHNPYSKAPWVISVAAGVKDGSLADFSSRGTKGVGGTFTVDGEEWTWVDQPTITAPGVDIISTRVIAPVSSLALADDAEQIESAHLPYYTLMSGTSMATPHVAGIVALMLEANQNLTPDEIKTILQDTATNMPGYEAWEVGAGYVNAYNAVDQAMFGTEYGKTTNMNQDFNSSADSEIEREEFSVDYNPATLVSDNQHEFTVEEGLTSLVAKVNGKGILEETGNPINLVLISPDGTEYSSGISLLFTLYTDRTVSVNAPMAGTWKAEIRGIRGAEENPVGSGTPENVKGTLTYKSVSGFTGLNDIEGHPAAAAIKTSVNERLVDGLANGSYLPDANLLRKEMAKYLVMGAEIRQQLPAESTISDVNVADQPFVEAVVAKGAALKGGSYETNGVMKATSSSFNPNGTVSKAEVAYSLVQSLGLQEQAEGHEGDVTVQYGDERLMIEDASDIPAELKGYVQLALDLNILNAKFNVTQRPYDHEPTVHATFAPNETVKRGDFAVAISRYFNAYHQ
ncbi:S8 family serine peptidase [Pseudalkalibacillus berkeleyi]|uniref:S8 family serine peptidase n=1 Tax=Pseudalkalibacillus berkeleyi TaxID=1069813 RepID=A0ABS9GXQ3_9BACL|nr:S8 family serine peptidase [Pseudalkalibacillus berkeleyi]MCF6136446.1 S8 family serine peptidase [Pseudalkalibacillus berkeleyi]